MGYQIKAARIEAARLQKSSIAEKRQSTAEGWDDDSRLLDAESILSCTSPAEEPRRLAALTVASHVPHNPYNLQQRHGVANLFNGLGNS